jgi:hypothetical protein
VQHLQPEQELAAGAPYVDHEHGHLLIVSDIQVLEIEIALAFGFVSDFEFDTPLYHIIRHYKKIQFISNHHNAINVLIERIPLDHCLDRKSNSISTRKYPPRSMLVLKGQGCPKA